MTEPMTAQEFAAATRRRSIAAYGSEGALDLAIANHDVDRILARRELAAQRRKRKPLLTPVDTDAPTDGNDGE